MEPFDNKDKVPDFFASRAEKQADDMLDDFEKAKERLRFPMTDDEPVQDKKTIPEHSRIMKAICASVTVSAA